MILPEDIFDEETEAALDTAAAPVQNFLLFDYEVIHGTASNGQKSGGNLYPAPALQVFPGERLIVHFENSLAGLTIRDYFSPQYTPKGQPVPLYPEQLTSSPINLHTHGAHISPKGNADNVMLHIPPGMANTYTYDIPRNMPQGLYWYHCHLHGLTAAQVYAGLVGLLAIGRTDGNLPLVRFLIAHDASVNARDRSGATPLIGAVAKGRLAVVRLLLAHHASVMALL